MNDALDARAHWTKLARELLDMLEGRKVNLVHDGRGYAGVVEKDNLRGISTYHVTKKSKEGIETRLSFNACQVKEIGFGIYAKHITVITY